MSTNILTHMDNGQRLFTYKVTTDSGSAPNPYGGVCTLAICKPAIRSAAKLGDIIVGLTPGNEGRIIYCMQITEKMSWKEYIDLCTNSAKLDVDTVYSKMSIKVPKSENDPGDCIWRNPDYYEEVLPSWSMHSGEEDFNHDVKNRPFVLLSTRFWYFGSGNQFKIFLPENIRKIIPGRGHKSTSNNNYRDDFFDFFNSAIIRNMIAKFGKYGQPEKSSEAEKPSEPSRCSSLAMSRAKDMD
jgi:Nucleotide modification associated domain 2